MRQKIKIDESKTIDVQDVINALHDLVLLSILAGIEIR